jgi:hypothetical protein
VAANAALKAVATMIRLLKKEGSKFIKISVREL